MRKDELNIACNGNFGKHFPISICFMLHIDRNATRTKYELIYQSYSI